VAATLAILILLTTSTDAPHNEGARAATLTEYVVWMTLPATSDTSDICYDSIPGPPTSDLEWLRLKGWRLGYQDSFSTSVNVRGMEGDSIGLGVIVPQYSHFQFRFSLVDTAGNESCYQWWLGAVADSQPR
jgi:hypothetical protein